VALPRLATEIKGKRMSELQQHVREVEAARAKLTADLAVLRSPTTFDSFTADLKQEAVETKDALLDKAKTTAQSAVGNFVEDLKAKVAANPAAALAIGAGLAWRLIKNPPIATALVGVGLVSLFRTSASRPANGVQPDYLAQGKQRLKEQGSELVAKIGDVAQETKNTVADQATALVGRASDKFSDLSESTRETVKTWSDTARAAGDQAMGTIGSQAETLTDVARRSFHDARDQISDQSAELYANAERQVTDWAQSSKQALRDDDTRDKLLLGAAGLAVAAALGIACQKRISEHLDQTRR
jgi:hypothetical protein